MTYNDSLYINSTRSCVTGTGGQNNITDIPGVLYARFTSSSTSSLSNRLFQHQL